MSLIPFFIISDDVRHYTGFPFFIIKRQSCDIVLEIYLEQNVLYESLRLFSVWQLDLVS